MIWKEVLSICLMPLQNDLEDTKKILFACLLYIKEYDQRKWLPQGLWFFEEAIGATNPRPPSLAFPPRVHRLAGYVSSSDTIRSLKSENETYSARGEGQGIPASSSSLSFGKRECRLHSSGRPSLVLWLTSATLHTCPALRSPAGANGRAAFTVCYACWTELRASAFER